MSAACVAAACDVSKPHDQVVQGPGIHVLGVNVSATTPMPADGVIQIAVDRYLLPASVTRQSVVVIDASNTALSPDKAPNVLYDPIARTVTLVGPSQPWLTPGQPYKVVLTIPKSPSDPGLRAIDGAAVAPTAGGGAPEFAFNVAVPDVDAGVRSTFAARGEPDSVSFCKDVLPIFFTKCSAPLCHGSGGKAAASLTLDTANGVANTALNRVAQGSNRGALAGLPAAEGPVFGIDMPILAVDPTTSTGSAANSWLMYKLDIAPLPTAPAPKPVVTCDFTASDPTPAQPGPYIALAPATTASDAERAALTDRILGNYMPYPAGPGATGYDQQPLTLQERETIRMWIDRGAPIVECGGCVETSPVADAGSDAGP